jgi:hypothetical protein
MNPPTTTARAFVSASQSLKKLLDFTLELGYPRVFRGRGRFR